MFSPIFECTLDGLRSAVRLRYVVWGVENPDAKTDTYMRGYAISEENHADPAVIRKRIEVIIDNIETATAEQQASTSLDARICQPHSKVASGVVLINPCS